VGTDDGERWGSVLDSGHETAGADTDHHDGGGEQAAHLNGLATMSMKVRLRLDASKWSGIEEQPHPIGRLR
jgi:hypothetical protein